MPGAHAWWLVCLCACVVLCRGGDRSEADDGGMARIARAARNYSACLHPLIADAVREPPPREDAAIGAAVAAAGGSGRQVLDYWGEQRVFRGRWRAAAGASQLGLRGSAGYFAFSLGNARDMSPAAGQAGVAGSGDALVWGELALRESEYIGAAGIEFFASGVLRRRAARLELVADPTYDGELSCGAPIASYNGSDAAARGWAEPGRRFACALRVRLALSLLAASDALDWAVHADVTAQPAEHAIDLWRAVGTASGAQCPGLALVLTADEPDPDAFVRRAFFYAILFVGAALLQIYALVDQMAYTATDAAAARVSVVMVGMLAIMDCHASLVLLSSGASTPDVFRAFAIVAFFKFALFGVFEMRYMLVVWRASRAQAWSDGAVTMRRELSLLYARLYGGLCVAMVVLYFLEAQVILITLLMSSFWLPQILCNVHRDTARALSHRYMAFNTLGRLIVPAYVHLYPHNIFRVQPTPGSFAIVVLFAAAQVAVLVSQDMRGARWFVPRSLLPQRYSYARAIPPGADRTCAICMTTTGDAGDGGGDDVENGAAVVTPCDHVFHSACLQQWTDIRLECPTCRAPLPPTQSAHAS